MLTLSRVTGAGESSVVATRDQGRHLVPRDAYSFGAGAVIKRAPNMTIEPVPVRHVIQVHSGAVMPRGLPGGALPQDVAVMGDGKMRKLGRPLDRTPEQFETGLKASRKILKGNARDIRRIGGALVPAPTMGRDVDPRVMRAVMMRDQRLNDSADDTILVTRSGFTPDDRIRSRSTQAVEPGPMVHRNHLQSAVSAPRGGGVMGGSPQLATDTVPDQAASALARSLAETVFGIGLAVAAVAAGIWYLSSED